MIVDIKVIEIDEWEVPPEFTAGFYTWSDFGAVHLGTRNQQPMVYTELTIEHSWTEPNDNR